MKRMLQCVGVLVLLFAHLQTKAQAPTWTRNNDPTYSYYTVVGGEFDLHDPAPPVSWTLTGATSGSGSGQSIDGIQLNIGTTTLSYSDGNGTWNYLIEIDDNESPVVTGSGSSPQTVSRQNDAGHTYYTIQGSEFDVTAGDNSGSVSVSYSLSGATTGSGSGSSLNTLGITLNMGTTAITFTATDGSSNTTTYIYYVIVSEDPNAVPAFTSYFIHIPTSSDAPDVNYGTWANLTFPTHSALDATAAKYIFKQFRKAFPNSSTSGLTDMYIIEVNDATFLDELEAFDNTKYTGREVANFSTFYITLPDGSYVPTVSTSNYQTSVTFAQSGVNTIIADYNFKQFQLAFPNSSDVGQASIYIVEAATPFAIWDGSGDFPLGPTLHTYDAPKFTDPITQKLYPSFISITDPSYIPSIGSCTSMMPGTSQVCLDFSNSTLNGIAAKYTITRFVQAFPQSDLENLRQVYYVVTNDKQFRNDLHDFNNQIFDAPDQAPTYAMHFTPSDFGKAVNAIGQPIPQQDLLLVGAQAAWDSSRGDASLKVGVVDSWVDTKHPDLQGKIGKVYHNAPVDTESLKPFHGTGVAGFIAARTNTTPDTSISAMGFDTHVGICSFPPHDINMHVSPEDTLLQMSKDGYRLMNGSWGYSDSCASTYESDILNSFFLHMHSEELYNEIYENGSVMVFSAGNGNVGFKPGDKLPCGTTGDYMFPASYNHNISVTSVGSDVAIGSTVSSIIDIHDYYDTTKSSPGNPLPQESHYHNSRVDICAPGYTDVAAVSIPGQPVKYMNNMNGTSFAAPIVSGTVALMLAKNPCMNPYQVEWMLKKTAFSALYGYDLNKKYNARKELGAGRLQADSAVRRTSRFKCNDTVKAMEILGVKVNHLCLGAGSLIKFTPIIKNGNPPYTYRWVPLAGNSCNLDDYYAAEPQVSSSSPSTGQPNLAYFMLAVTDHSDIPKVANTRFKARLRTSGYDLGMRDSYHDMYNDDINDMIQVNNKDWNIWFSPDIWIRSDDLTGDPATDTIPQNARHDKTNHILVRVKNVGCSQSPANKELHLYWTKAGLGEPWDSAWVAGQSATIKELNTATPPVKIPVGGEITTSGSPLLIPALNVGEEKILDYDWISPDPADFASTNGKSMDACLLARIYDSTAAPHGLVEVQGNITTNVLTNNNIVTRNMTFTRMGMNKLAEKHVVDITRGGLHTNIMNIQLMTDKDNYRFLSGDLSEYVYAELHLGELFDRWAAGGYQGYTDVGSVDEVNKTITYNPSHAIHLNNIEIDSNERIPIDVQFKLKDDISVPNDFEMPVILRQTIINDAENEEVTGAYIFDLQLFADSFSMAKKTKVEDIAEKKSDDYLVYPNPYTKRLSILTKQTDPRLAEVYVVDAVGRIMFRAKDIAFKGNLYQINTTTFTPGIYYVHITDDRGNNSTFQVVKTSD